jgi:hypothetical protein
MLLDLSGMIEESRQRGLWGLQIWARNWEQGISPISIHLHIHSRHPSSLSQDDDQADHLRFQWLGPPFQHISPRCGETMGLEATLASMGQHRQHGSNALETTT